jgi:uncharacterized protein YbbK (DUF523 family)
MKAREIRVGVSGCLLGEQVRYDGSHKRDAFLTDVLGPFVTWVAVCPEVEIGLGTPREPIRLVGGDACTPRLVAQRSGADLTRRMERFAAAKARELDALGLDGYVLKRASPSCGLFDVPVHDEAGGRPHAGRGVYAAALARRLPALPMEEEGRLCDAAIRESFVERIFTAARWRALMAAAPRSRHLLAFHAAHKPVVRAHSPSHEADLDRLVAGAERTVTRTLLAEYGGLLMEAVAARAPRAHPAHVLDDLLGAAEQDLELIEDYRTMARLLRV